NIACRNVSVWPQMTIKLRHQCLTKTHHFAFTFTFRIEVTSAFTAAHRQSGQGVFEGLLEAKEFKNGKIYRWVETHTAFIRTNSGVELNAPCTVNLYLTAIINPNYAKLDGTLWFNQTFQ